MNILDYDQFLFDTLTLEQMAILSFALLYNPDHIEYYEAFKSGDYDACKQYVLDNKDEIKMENVPEKHKDVAKDSLEQYNKIGADQVREMYRQHSEKQVKMEKKNAEEDKREKEVTEENISKRLKKVEEVLKFDMHTEAKGSELTDEEKARVIDSMLIIYYFKELDNMNFGNFGLNLNKEGEDAIDTILECGWKLSPKSMAETAFEIMIMAYGEENAQKFAQNELPFTLSLMKTYHEEGKEAAQEKIDELMAQQEEIKKMMAQQEGPQLTQEERVELDKKKLEHLKNTTFTKINFPTKEQMEKAVDEFEAPEEFKEAPEELVKMLAQQEVYHKIKDTPVEGKTEFTFDDIRNDENIDFNSDNLITTNSGYAYTYPSFDEEEQHDVSTWSIINTIVRRNTGEEGNEKEEGNAYYDYDKNEMVVFQEA